MSDSPTLGFTILAFGGPALFLLAQLFVFRETLDRIPRSRPLALDLRGSHERRVIGADVGRE